MIIIIIILLFYLVIAPLVQTIINKYHRGIKNSSPQIASNAGTRTSSCMQQWQLQFIFSYWNDIFSERSPFKHQRPINSGMNQWASRLTSPSTTWGWRQFRFHLFYSLKFIYTGATSYILLQVFHYLMAQQTHVCACAEKVSGKHWRHEYSYKLLWTCSGLQLCSSFNVLEY